MNPITRFFQLTKRPSNTSQNGVAKKAHIETVPVQEESPILIGGQPAAPLDEEERSKDSDEVQIIVLPVEHNIDLTFKMLKIIDPGDHFHNVAKLFAPSISEDPDNEKIHTYCQIFDKRSKKVYNYSVSFNDMHL